MTIPRLGSPFRSNTMRKFFCTLAAFALLAIPFTNAASAAETTPPTTKPARALPPLPTSHTTKQIEGWTVRIDDRLLEGDGAAIGERAIKLLTARLVTIAIVV